MNHFYRSMWNATLGCWVAAPETARVAGIGSESCAQGEPTVSPHLRLGWRPAALALAVAAWAPGVAMAAPVAPSIQVLGDVQNAGTPVTASPASPWNLGSNALGVGVTNFGSLYIDGGATVTSGAVYLGLGSSIDGWVEVQGGGSRLSTQGLYVGYTGSGRLIIGNGSTVSSTYTQVGNSSESASLVEVRGANSTWTNSGTLLLGVHGDARLIIEGGGVVQTGAITLGSGSTSTARGIVEITGSAINGRGVLETTQLTKGTSDSNLIINGGILRASAHQNDFLKGFTALTLGVQGAYFDTNGYDMGVGTAFASAPGGGLFKQGAGTLTLRGASTYSGGTTISGGTLVAAHASALGTGNVTVGTGAALEVASGTALEVGGDLTFQSGSNYRIYAGPNGATSSTHVAGTATLDGSVLHVGPKNNFAVATPYVILRADQGFNGTEFSSVSSNYAFLNASLSYSTDEVTLSLQGVEDFGSRVDSSNQKALARSVQLLGAGNVIYQHLVQADNSQAAAVANGLSGDAHASVNSAIGMLGAQAPSISQNHLRSNLTAGMRPGAPVAQSDGPLPASALPSSKALPAWVEVVGNWQRFNGNGNAPGLKQNTAGLFLGGDEEVGTSGWRVGGSVGYTQSDAKVNSRAASADISSYSAAVYAGKSFAHGTNRVNVLGGLAYTHHSIESERTVSSLSQNLKADYSGYTAQLFAEVGYAMGQYDKQGLEPFVGITLGEQRTGSFQETGGFVALSSQSSSDTLASTTLGVRAHSDFKLAGKDTRVKATLGVRHAWGSLSQNRTMAFEGSSSFTVAGAPLARNTALVGLQAEMELSRRAALVLGYNGEFGSGNRDHSANVKLRWAY